MTTVSDLFDVRYGHSLELNRLKRSSFSDGIAFVSRKMGDNGVSAFVERISDVEPASPGQITVALSGNGVMSAFLQDRPFYTGHHVAILSCKGKQLSVPAMLYYCMCIKANRYRFNYGRQANRSLKNIAVPKVTQLPKWLTAVEVDCFTGAESSRLTSGPVKLPDPSKWGEFRIDSLFALKKGKRLTKAQMRPGSTPFIGAIDDNNGLTAFVEQEPLHEANTLTVNYNGNGVAETFYQPVPYRCSDDVNVLYPQFPMTPGIGLFVATVIRLEKYRFSYGRKWGLEAVS